MVKYNSKGNLPQKADYYALLNRSDADWRDSVRQGLVSCYNGSSSLCYLGSAIDLTGDHSIKMVFKADDFSVLQYIIGEVVTVPTTQRFYYYINSITGTLRIRVGTGAVIDISEGITAGAWYAWYASYNAVSGVITSKLRTLSTGSLTDLADYTVSGLTSTEGTFNIGSSNGSAGFFKGCIADVTIWKSTKTVAQMDSTKTDAELRIPFSGSVLDISGNYMVSSTDVDYSRSDYASFNCDEHSFAIGTTLVGNASGCLNYGVRNLITTSTAKMRWQFKLNTVAGAGTDRYICSEYRTTGDKRGWGWFITSANRVSVIVGADGGGYASVNASPQDGGGNYYSPQLGDFVDVKWESGIITVLVNNTTTYTLNASATQTVIYNNNSPDLNIGGYQSGLTYAFNGSLSCFKIWVDSISDDDTPKFECDYRGTTTDKISGTIPSVVGSMVYVPQIHPRLLDDSGYAGTITGPYEEFPVKPYPNTFTGNWHELTHAYFDKSNTNIWEDFIRNSINYDSVNTNRWHVDELNPSYLEKYLKPDYRNKIFCGIDKGDYAGAIMVFESGIPEILKKDLRFWRKRKYFEVATRKIDIELGIEYTLTGKSDSATVKIEAYNGENWIVMATGVTVTAGEYSEGITFSPYDFEGEVTYLMRVVSEVDDSVEELIDVTSDTVVRIIATTTGASEDVILNRIKLSEDSIIFWGDGDSTTLTRNTTYNNLTHTYTVAGSYQVKIAKADKVKDFRLSNNKWSNFTSYDLRNADIDYFQLNATGSGFTVDTSHMTGWTVGSAWYLRLMPAGTYNIDTSHMTGWTVGGSWYLHSMPAGTYNIDTSHMTGWTVSTDWYLRSMPAGTYNLGTTPIRNWTGVDRIDLYSLIDETTETNMMTEAEVIKVIEDIYAGRLTFTHTLPILNIAGTNASLTDAGARTKVDHLRAGDDGVNTFRAWTINVNGYPA